ncbi:hypothetical protein BH11MYX1_BH11MYX1_48970 [soil metagenome]
MRTTLLVPLVITALAHTISAQSAPPAAPVAPAPPAPPAPDDRYAKQLAGQPLVEGKGFAGVVELGTPTPRMYKALGPGREDTGFVFWYFYDRGPWQLTVMAETTPTNDFQTRAIEISGAKAPATARGIRIGDTAAQVTKVYGAGEAFTGTVGDPKFEHMTTHDLRDGSSHVLPDIEATYRGGVFYPALGTLFVMNGAVERIVVVSPAAVPKTKGALLGLLVHEIDRFDAKLEVEVNGMPIVKTDEYESSRGAGDPYLMIPRFVLRKGTNTLHIGYSEVNPAPRHGLDIALVEFGKLEPQTVANVVQHIAPAAVTKDHPFGADYTFEVTGEVPHWSYETAPVITASPAMETKLKAAATALAHHWNTSKRLTGFEEQARDPSRRNLARWIAHPKLEVDSRAADATLQVIANGRLARLTWDTIYPWFIKGGGYDVPAGHRGPVDIQFDVWFRLDRHGAFVPVAVWPPDTGTNHP